MAISISLITLLAVAVWRSTSSPPEALARPRVHPVRLLPGIEQRRPGNPHHRHQHHPRPDRPGLTSPQPKEVVNTSNRDQHRHRSSGGSQPPRHRDRGRRHAPQGTRHDPAPVRRDHPPSPTARHHAQRPSTTCSPPPGPRSAPTRTARKTRSTTCATNSPRKASSAPSGHQERP